MSYENTSMNKLHKNKKQRQRRFVLEHWKIISVYLLIYDIFAVNFSYFFGLWLRFDLQYSQIPKDYLISWLHFTPVYTLVAVIIFWATRLYQSIWRYASFEELNRLLQASVLTALFHVIVITAFYQRMPISYYMIGTVTQFFLMVGVRFSYRFVTLERIKISRKRRVLKNTMLIGAGAAGRTILRELKNSQDSDTQVCCIIDDNCNKWGRFLEDVPIVGGREQILEAVEKYQIQQILFGIPSAKASARKEILNICKESGCELRSLPGISQLVKGEVLLSKMKPVAVEDLLGRDPIKVNMQEIFDTLQGKIILVTGGGGSIGSELCRQIAEHEPKQLIIFDIYENNAYDIEQELKRNYPKLNLVVLIGSVRDSRRLQDVFETYHPQIVYHAAAHKHVPLMESSPNEAIKNNVVGTYKTAYAALKYGAQRFVLISTDKAVNPTNIMGASKRLCEMVIQTMDAIGKGGRMDLLPYLHAHVDRAMDGQPALEECDRQTVEQAKVSIESVRNQNREGTQFVAVRFGNVLGSNGSVIPLFKKQIAAGGPVTVTHPDIVRYFMTIPEAVSLVLQAGTYAWGGEIFVLDMGEPVKIDTLARNLIRLSGYEPDVDIKIEYSGLRPGEKLYEERLMAEEGLKKTENELISIGKPIPFDVERFLCQLEQLARASYNNDPEILEKVAEIVPTFHPQMK